MKILARQTQDQLIDRILNRDTISILYKTTIDSNTDRNSKELLIDTLITIIKGKADHFFIEWDTANETSPYIYSPTYNLMKIFSANNIFARYSKQLTDAYFSWDSKSDLNYIWNDGHQKAAQYLLDILNNLPIQIVVFLRHVHWTAEDTQEDSWIYTSEIPILTKSMTLIMDVYENVRPDNSFMTYFDYFVDETN